jgi:VWFA-related protein
MRQLLFTCLLVFSGVAVQAQQPTAPEILKKSAAVYSSCRTYSDEGTANLKPIGLPFAVPGMQTHFQTAFVGPERFRFEVKGPGKIGTWIVWTNGDEIRTSGEPGTLFDTFKSLDAALLQLGFTSGGSSLTVPQLLLAKYLRADDLFSLISNPTFTGEEKIDGHKAFRIEATIWDEPIKIWIDRAEYLILKVSRTTGLGTRGQEITIQYKPKINVDIAPERLVAPPAPNQLVTTTNVPPPSLPSITRPNLKRFGSSLLAIQDASEKTVGQSNGDDDVVRVDTDLVVSSVLVVDPAGKIINGLTKDDFVVMEDDKPQEVASLSRGDSKELARSIVLIIDYSGSQLPYIRTSVESAKMLVEKLNPKDRMAIVTDDVKLIADFTSDKEYLKSQLEKLKVSARAGYIGASDQFDAMMATLNELFDGEDIRPIVIFQTDGDELESLKGNFPGMPFWLPRRFSFNDILAAAERTKVTIYPVISGMRYVGVPDAELSQRALTDWDNRQKASIELLRARNLPFGPVRNDPKGPSPEFLSRYAQQWRTRQLAMVQMAKLTGAWPEFLEQPGQADEIYTRILTDIDRRYIIGYYPTNRTRDGKRRKVAVEVRNHPEYLVWGQRSYFARAN